MKTFRIYALNKFQMEQPMVFTVLTTLYITFLVLSDLMIGNCTFWPPSFQFPLSPSACGNHKCDLFFCEFFFLIPHLREMSKIIQHSSFFDLSPLAQFLQVSSILLQMARIALFLWLNSISCVCVCVCVCVSVASMAWLLWVVWQWIRGANIFLSLWFHFLWINTQK